MSRPRKPGDGSWLMRPPSRGEELVAVRPQIAEILKVPAAWALIHGGVELEAHHVEPARQPSDQAAVVARLETRDEAVRQTEVEQGVRAGIEPVVREPERSTDVDDRVPEWCRHRADQHDAIWRLRAKDVEILGGRPLDELTQDEVAATDEDQLVVQSTGRQQLAEGGQRCLQLGPPEHVHAGTIRWMSVSVNLSIR